MLWLSIDNGCKTWLWQDMCGMIRDFFALLPLPAVAFPTMRRLLALWDDASWPLGTSWWFSPWSHYPILIIIRNACISTLQSLYESRLYYFDVPGRFLFIWKLMFQEDSCFFNYLLLRNQSVQLSGLWLVFHYRLPTLVSGHPRNKVESLKLLWRIWGCRDQTKYPSTIHSVTSLC